MKDPHPLANPPTRSLSREGWMLRTLLLVGCGAILAIWAMESVRGEVSHWDRWAYPGMLAVLTACAAVLTWWPQWTTGVRVVAVAVFNGYLLLSLHLVLFDVAEAPDPYQLLSSLFWMPMGYGTAFIFLGMPLALLFSLVLFAATFGPVFWHVAVGDMPHWPAYLAPMISNLAVAQVVYVVVLLAVSRLRDDYHRSQARVELMRQVASTDPLTGLLNRRSLADHIAAGQALVRRAAQPLSVVLIDVDHFKQINDGLGHAAGDAVLVELSALISAQLRGSDQIGRWGGEEFLIVAPATAQEAARELAERIRQAVADPSLLPGRPVTVSLGVAECQPLESVDALIQRADLALYAAKAAGRNRVCLADAFSPSGSSA
jgi:diguanylate cyclase (GGDEF)-like protein